MRYSEIYAAYLLIALRDYVSNDVRSAHKHFLMLNKPYIRLVYMNSEAEEYLVSHLKIIEEKGYIHTGREDIFCLTAKGHDFIDDTFFSLKKLLGDNLG